MTNQAVPEEPDRDHPPTGPTPAPAGEQPTVPVDSPAPPVDDLTWPADAPPTDDAPPTADAPPPGAGPAASLPPPSDFPPPGFPPPGGFPPPPPGGFPPPPGDTAGWAAARFGLVRPGEGRMMAGVCAAVGRATNTDPVLWRVLFAVLTLAGGVGLLAYLLGWLLIPAEGDTGSPVEALLGRGHSSTSPVIVIVGGVVGAITLGSLAYQGMRSIAILAVLIVGAIIVISRGGLRSTGAPPPGPYPGGDPGADIPPWRTGQTAWTDPVPGAPAGVAPADTVPMQATDAPAAPAAPGTGYRPPFAPHGPYASPSRYPYPGLNPTPPPPAAPPPAPAPPRRPPSRLGRVIFSVTLLVLGVLAIIDTAGGNVPFTSYVATALATLGVGLLVGAWFGRARWFIPLGMLLVVALAAGAALDRVDVRHVGRQSGDITWMPSTAAQVDDSYQHDFGDATLDLTRVDFTGTSKAVTVNATAGDLTILLPPNVDTVVHGGVVVGQARVFNEEWGGVRSAQHDVTDDGADGPGGGQLRITVQLRVGDLEVHR